MKLHKSLLIASVIMILISVSTVYSADKISFGISVNTSPQLKPNETAIVYVKGINNGQVTFDMNITLLDNGGLSVTITPEHIESVEPNEQFYVRITFTTNVSETAYHKVRVEFLAYTTEEIEGVGASLSTSLIINFNVYVSPNANTTIEEKPAGFYIPTTEEEIPTQAGIQIRDIGIAIGIVIIFIVILILWLKRGKVHV